MFFTTRSTRTHVRARTRHATLPAILPAVSLLARMHPHHLLSPPAKHQSNEVRPLAARSSNRYAVQLARVGAYEGGAADLHLEPRHQQAALSMAGIASRRGQAHLAPVPCGSHPRLGADSHRSPRKQRAIWVATLMASRTFRRARSRPSGRCCCRHAAPSPAPPLASSVDFDSTRHGRALA
jgi:hypothetical protein